MSFRSCEVMADTTDLYEPFLEDNTPAMKILPPLYVEGAKQISHKEIQQIPDQPFYSTEYFTERMLGFLKERDESKPFFAYLPYTAPHCELALAFRVEAYAPRAAASAARDHCQVQGSLR